MIELQEDYEAEGVPVQFLAVNETLRGGSYLELVSTNHDLPVLQDTEDVGAWTAWGVVQRDLVLLDGQNEVVAEYSMNVEDMRDPAFQATLDALIREAAGDLPTH